MQSLEKLQLRWRRRYLAKELGEYSTLAWSLLLLALVVLVLASVEWSGWVSTATPSGKSAWVTRLSSSLLHCDAEVTAAPPSKKAARGTIARDGPPVTAAFRDVFVFFLAVFVLLFLPWLVEDFVRALFLPARTLLSLSVFRGGMTVGNITLPGTHGCHR